MREITGCVEKNGVMPIDNLVDNFLGMSEQQSWRIRRLDRYVYKGALAIQDDAKND